MTEEVPMVVHLIIKQTKSGFDQRDSGQAGKQNKSEQMQHQINQIQPPSDSIPLCGAFGAPEGGFGGERDVFAQLVIVFANFGLFFGVARVCLITF